MKKLATKRVNLDLSCIPPGSRAVEAARYPECSESMQGSRPPRDLIGSTGALCRRLVLQLLADIAYAVFPFAFHLSSLRGYIRLKIELNLFLQNNYISGTHIQCMYHHILYIHIMVKWKWGK